MHLLRPGGGLEGGVIAPGVVIESEEVTSLVVSTAVHVVGGLDTIVINISSRIADRDLAVFAVANVLLHVASDSFDVWRRSGSWNAVDIFVPREEEQGVAVSLECINGGEDALQIFGVVRIGWGVLIDGVLRRIDIQRKVNPSGCKCVHAGIVICTIVDGVDANGINLKLLKPGYAMLDNSLHSKGNCGSYSAISRVHVD